MNVRRHSVLSTECVTCEIASGAPSADDVSKLLASASKSIKRTSSDVSALTRHKAVLDDQQRAAFRRLRDLLNDLVGD